MESILKGGTELILGGKELSVMFVGITILAILLAVGILTLMIKRPPSSLFGQIAFIIGALATLMLSLFIGMRGIKMII